MKIGDLYALLKELEELNEKEFLSPSQSKKKEKIEQTEVYVRRRRTYAEMMHTPLG